MWMTHSAAHGINAMVPSNQGSVALETQGLGKHPLALRRAGTSMAPCFHRAGEAPEPALLRLPGKDSPHWAAPDRPEGFCSGCKSARWSFVLLHSQIPPIKADPQEAGPRSLRLYRECTDRLLYKDL